MDASILKRQKRSGINCLACRKGAAVATLEGREPLFDEQSPQRRYDRKLAILRLLQGLSKCVAVYDSRALGGHVFGPFEQREQFRSQRSERRASDKRLAPAVEDFWRHDPDKRAAHEGPSLMRPHELFPWNGVKKLQQISVEVGIPPFDRELRRKADT